MDRDNAVLVRRLVGAAILLLLAFGVSLILPDPSKPPETDPGMQRVELRVADGAVVDPTQKPSAAVADRPSEDDAESAGSNASAPQSLDMAVSPEMEMPSVSEDEPAGAVTEPKAPPSKPAAATVVAPAVVRPQPTPAAPPPVSKPKIQEAPLPSTAQKAPIVPPTPKPTVVAPIPPPEKTPAIPAVTNVGPRATITIPVPPPVEPETRIPTPAPVPIPSPAAKPPTAPASAKGWQIQAGSYADIDNARQVQDQLKALGYAATLSIIEAGGSARYRIRCGPFATRDLAEAARKRLEQSHIPASLVAEGA